MCVTMCAFVCAQHGGDAMSPAASTLAMVLIRGLSVEHQKNSRESLQYSSGYSTQTNTPSCSEDTIPSQGNKHSTHIPLNSTLLYSISFFKPLFMQVIIIELKYLTYST